MTGSLMNRACFLQVSFIKQIWNFPLTVSSEQRSTSLISHFLFFFLSLTDSIFKWLINLNKVGLSKKFTKLIYRKTSVNDLSGIVKKPPREVELLKMLFILEGKFFVEDLADRRCFVRSSVPVEGQLKVTVSYGCLLAQLPRGQLHVCHHRLLCGSSYVQIS